MKTSNILLLSGIVVITGMVLGASLGGEYVSQQAYDRNQTESLKSLSVHTHGQKTIVLDRSFTRIVFRDTATRKTSYLTSGHYMGIRWVKSEQFGLKVPKGQKIIERTVFEDSTLFVYFANPEIRNEDIMTVYSPSLSQLTVDNTGMLQLIDTEMDTLSATTLAAHFKIDETCTINKLDLRVDGNGEMVVRGRYIEEAWYTLSAGGIVRSQIDSCGKLNIVGDGTNTVLITPNTEARLIPHRHYGSIAYNDGIGRVLIENTTVDKIKGNRDKLTLYMTTKQIDHTFAAIANE